jgi:hypothetical protein
MTLDWTTFAIIVVQFFLGAGCGWIIRSGKADLKDLRRERDVELDVPEFVTNDR